MSATPLMSAAARRCLESTQENLSETGYADGEIEKLVKRLGVLRLMVIFST